MTDRLRAICLVVIVCALVLGSLFILPQIAMAQGHGGGQLNEFIYVSEVSGDIEGFQINSKGALSPAAGSPFAAGVSVTGLATISLGLELYASDGGSNTVEGFTITGGVLNPVAGSPFTSPVGPNGIVVDSQKSTVYVANCGTSCFGTGSGSVSAYHLDRLTGSLTTVPGSPFAAGASTGQVTTDPTGRFVYATNFGSNDVSAYSVTRSGGLTRIAGSPYGVGSTPIGLDIDPVANFIFVVNSNSNNISVFSYSTEDGSLTEVEGSPFPTTASPATIAVDATGKFAYVTATDGIEAFSISSSGSLTPLVGSPFAGPTIPFVVTLERTGHFLYVDGLTSDFTGTLSAYSVNLTTGALTPLAGSPYALQSVPLALVASPQPK